MAAHSEIMAEGNRRTRAAWDTLRARGEDFDREAVFEAAFYTAVGDLLEQD